jgi:hypothetical protein
MTDKKIITVESEGMKVTYELPFDASMYDLAYMFYGICKFLTFSNDTIDQFISVEGEAYVRNEDYDDPTYYDEQAGYCMSCEHELAEIRPGRYQCINMTCPQYIPNSNSDCDRKLYIENDDGRQK